MSKRRRGWKEDESGRMGEGGGGRVGAAGRVD